MPSSKSPSKTPTRPRGACGRADLALALADGNAALALAVAEFTGYEWRAPEDEPEKKPEKKPDEDGGERPEPPSPEIVARPLAETPFWQPTRYEPLDEGEPTPRPPTTPYGGWSLRPKNRRRFRRWPTGASWSRGCAVRFVCHSKAGRSIWS